MSDAPVARPLTNAVRPEVLADKSDGGARPAHGARGTRNMKSKTREAIAAYVFLIPWLLGLAGFTLGPMIYSLYLSFTSYDLLSDPRWVGFRNYVQMFTADPRYLKSVSVTLIYVVVSVPLLLIVSMLLALLLNKSMKFLTGYRALFYVPSLLGASVAIAALWRLVFGADGILNKALAVFGIQHGSWVGNPDDALTTIITLTLWAFGSTMIIFLAGLKQIPKELSEAAAMDGAGTLRRFFSVTLPLMTPLIFFNALMGTIHAFQSFTGAYVVSGGTGGPADSTLFYTLYLYQRGFAQLDMGYASAMAWLLLAVLAAFSAFFFWTARFWVHYGDES
ncbi:MAG: binding-protein-dependent transport system inner rane component [Micrococcaceae bacterium]|jgi:multiple sugar transport system permease protein|nr:binding-protein-dependent transport system inner rane component [Micrococcaceae bacterium]